MSVHTYEDHERLCVKLSELIVEKNRLERKVEETIRHAREEINLVCDNNVNLTMDNANLTRRNAELTKAAGHARYFLEVINRNDSEAWMMLNAALGDAAFVQEGGVG